MKPLMRSLTVALLLALPGAVAALEKASPQAVHERSTSDPEQVSLKPVFLFDMRGRKDPFVPYALLTATARTGALDIREMRFGGLLEVRGQQMALFAALDKHYVLKGGRLYGPDGTQVEGVRGRVTMHGVNEGQAQLEQGETRLTFSDRRVSKRLEDQDNHD
jgi:hypothetical protein